ncbi:MAG TPA: hypothetical protein VJ836_02415 [Candidatus Saccharimonadales bacterium]|nr:hypothetical protein [Candidatus Saccharimonadales bacterium]
MLTDWNARYSERAKLQHAYLVASVISIIAAGLVGLLNYDASRVILRVCFIAIGIFLANAIAWALLYGLLIDKIPRRSNGRKHS